MKLFLACTLLAGTLAWAADPVPLDVKTGQWETTETPQISGSPLAMIPAEQLAKMPPEQRAKIEAAMKQAGNTPRTSKNCIKKEDLAKMNLNNDQTRTCKTTLVSSSRTKQEARIDCDSNTMKGTGTVVIEALNSESIKVNVHLAGTSNGQPLNMNINGTSRWLGATCTESK